MYPSLIPFQFPGVPSVECVFSTRIFGNISLDMGDDADAAALRLSLPDLFNVEGIAEVHQVHGVRTVFEPSVQDLRMASSEDADGLATSRRSIALMVKTADCQPILLAHEKGLFAAALHSGWKGSRQEYPYIAVCECCEHYGVDASELWAVRGPSLGPAAAEFVHFAKEWGNNFLPWYDEQCRSMDMWQMTKNQLQRAGMTPGRILGLDICTFENWKMLFSYRHFCKFKSKDGRQGSFIWIR